MSAAIRGVWVFVAVLAIVAALFAVVPVQLALAGDAVTAPAVPAPAPSIPGIIDAGGRVNVWLLFGTLGTVLWTNLAMVLLKKRFPRWDAKAWAPPVIGLVTAVLGAAATGQIHSIPTLVAWIIGGVGAGASASSLRDYAVGK